VAEANSSRRPVALALLLIVAGVLGIWAAFELTMDRFSTLENPSGALSCDLNLIVQCTKNLGSWQGSLFGFPNPIIGLVTWPATIVVGMSLLAGSRFPRWYWLLFNLGLLFAFAFIVFLSTQSIFVLGTLCLWCMLTWSVVIPSFLAVTFRNLAAGVFGSSAGLRRIGRIGSSWIVVITLVCYLAIAVAAQVRLDVLGSF
jgi:uncharacterized membrane protein